jgi:hypothetical protein
MQSSTWRPSPVPRLPLLPLAGDKVQTAINISLSAGHFSKSSRQYTMVGITDKDVCQRELEAIQQEVHGHEWGAAAVALGCSPIAVGCSWRCGPPMQATSMWATQDRTAALVRGRKPAVAGLPRLTGPVGISLLRTRTFDSGLGH